MASPGLGSVRPHKDSHFFGFTDSTFSLQTGVFDPDVSDSIRVTFDNVRKDFTGTTITYAPGYSYDKPFGNSVTTTLDPKSGIIEVSGISLSGLYQVGLKLESFKGGVKESEVLWDFPVTIDQAGSTAPDNKLNVTQFSGISSSTASNGKVFEMAEGDILQISASTQINPVDTVQFKQVWSALNKHRWYAQFMRWPDCMC